MKLQYCLNPQGSRKFYDLKIANMMESVFEQIVLHTGLTPRQIKSTLDLLKEGASIPFIARYRKERTQSLDEHQIRLIKSTSDLFEDLWNRKNFILDTLNEQGVLTSELKGKILEAKDMLTLEDLYLPFKKRRKTKADIAIENGLEPIAMRIIQKVKLNLDAELIPFIPTPYQSKIDALEGIKHIISDIINRDDELRLRLRNRIWNEGILVSKLSKGKENQAQKFKDYFKYHELVKKIPSHRYLAIRRGEEEKLLKVDVELNEIDFIEIIERKYFNDGSSKLSQIMKSAVEEAWSKMLFPSLVLQVNHRLKEKSDIAAIDVFGNNLRQILLEAPLGSKRILAIDPGFRSGCKVVCIDETGNLLNHFVIFPLEPVLEKSVSKEKLMSAINSYKILDIAIGDGTGGREVSAWLSEILESSNVNVHVVSESGASIYSASELAGSEFPELDLTFRGAISIGRRLMDPLSELIKIDPKSIGVGQYQHDVNQKILKDRLDQEIISCVNAVGVQVNTASVQLLSFVSGIGPTLAKNIVEYRDKNYEFKTKGELLNVPRFGQKAFEHSAGFLRVRDGKYPLDNTGVHPERYELVDAMAVSVNHTLEELISSKNFIQKIDLTKFISDSTNLDTLKDIINDISKPGLDPRGEIKLFSFDPTVKTINDIVQGMILPGIVLNITKFGAFIDIGIKESGLIHVSEMSAKFIEAPLKILSLRQKILVKVILVDYERKRIQLSIKDLDFKI